MKKSGAAAFPKAGTRPRRFGLTPFGRLGGPQVRNLNRRGDRWPRPPLVSLPRKYRRSVRYRAQPLYLLTPAGHFALRATAHWADASLRRTFGSLCHLRWQVSRLLNHSRFPNGRAHGFAAPLRVALGLRPKCPQGTRFPSRHRAHASLRCRAGGEFAPPAQTFLKHLAEKAGAAGLFRQAERPRRFVSPYTSRPGEWPGTPASPDATGRRSSPAPSRSA